MDTATFGLFRSACSKLYREFPPEEGYCKIEDTDDKKGKAVVQHTFRVFRVMSYTQLGYTVNLYPTNNRLLINGKDVDRFMDKHLPLLHEMMIKAMREFGFRGVEAMNNILCEQMRIVASQRRGVVCSPTPVVNETPCDSQAPDAASATQTSDSSMLKSADVGNTGKTLTRVRSSSHLLKQSQFKPRVIIVERDNLIGINPKQRTSARYALET